MTIKIIKHGKAFHTCDLPGRWRRRRLGLYYRAIITCEDCGKNWELAARSDGELYWKRPLIDILIPKPWMEE